MVSEAIFKFFNIFDEIFSTDIVFFIFLYQRWVYNVDTKRVNEFGFSAEMLEEKNKAAAANGQPKAIEASAADKPKDAADKKDD